MRYLSLVPERGVHSAIFKGSAVNLFIHISTVIMVYLTMTPALVAALNAVNQLGHDVGDDHYSLVHPSIGNPISHEQIIAISKLLRENHGNISVPYRLDDLLRGSRIYHEFPKPKAEPVSGIIHYFNCSC